MSYDLASIGSATGSRVDSAAKHIMACKMDTRLLSQWIQTRESDPQNYLHATKMQWCMHKDEIVLNTTKKLSVTAGDSSIKAYPLVVTTVGEMHSATQNFLKHLYRKSNATEFCNYLEAGIDNQTPFMNQFYASENVTKDEDKSLVAKQIKSLAEFRCQGVALGVAWASYLSGDTVASVLVGGMVTVQNGAFPMHTGDLVQWYFDFEENCFATKNKDTGKRIPEGDTDERSKRQKFNDERLYGTGSSLGRSHGTKNTKMVARIKSYHMHKVQLGDIAMYMDHHGDKSRVFAKCISGGRAWDQVDIMLMTQSL